LIFRKKSIYFWEVAYYLEAKVHGKLEGSCEITSSARGLDTIGGAADEGLVSAQAFCVGNNATPKVSIDYAWDGASYTIEKSVRGRTRYVCSGYVERTWERVLANEDRKGGCGSSGAEKSEGSGVETHYNCVRWG